MEVLRDKWAIPHIKAQSATDAYCALGFTIASERLFQMEIWARIARGSLAEVLGPKALPLDIQSRTLRYYSFMQTQWQRAKKTLAPQSIEKIEAFYQGVNEYAQNRPLPPEYTFLGQKQALLFGPADGLAFVGFMGFSFSSSMKADILLTQLQNKLSPALWQELKLESSLNRAMASNKKNKLNHHLLSTLTALSANQRFFPPWDGSNGWVLSASRSHSHKPLLANDPHIGLSLPSVWMEAHLLYPGFESYGHYLSLVPFAILGHTPHHAWGFTMSMIDDMDFYLENIDKEKLLVKYNDKWQKLQKNSEVIKVRGQKDYQLETFATTHGPLIDTISPLKIHDKLSDKQGIAMQWPFYHPDNFVFDALEGLSLAASKEEFKQAISKGHAPGINILYADTQNQIALWLFGKIPKREKGYDGTTLLDGNNPQEEVKGYYDFKLNPRIENPANGQIVSANFRPPATPFIPHLYGQWEPPERYQTLSRLLEGKERWSVEQLKVLQNWDSTDEVGWMKHTLLESLVLGESSALSSKVKTVVKILEEWDGHSDKDSVGAMIFHEWNRQAIWLILDELDEEEREIYSQISSHWYFYKKMLQQPENPWWDNPQTRRIEKAPEILTLAFNKMIEKLSDELGSNPKKWNWGQLHQVTYVHPLGRVWPLNQLFNLGPYPTSGAYNNPNNFRSLGFHDNHKVVITPSTRRLIDLADLKESWGILPTGISGHFLSPHYGDQVDLFLNGDYRKQVMDMNSKALKQKLIILPVQ